MLFFYASYSKKMKYLLEGYHLKFAAITAISIDCGFFPLCSALIHSIFLESLLVLTCLLVIMELSWLLLRISFVCISLYESRTRAVINIINNGLRILFAVTLYLYEVDGDNNFYNAIHFIFMLSYLFLWAIDLAICLCHFVVFGKYLCKSRVHPSATEVRKVID